MDNKINKIAMGIGGLVASLCCMSVAVAQDSDSTTFTPLNFNAPPIQTTGITGGYTPRPAPPAPPAPPAASLPPVTQTQQPTDPVLACASALNYTYSDFVNYFDFQQQNQGANTLISIEPNLVASDTNPNPKSCGSVNYYSCSVNNTTGAVSMSYTVAFLGPCNQGGSH